MAAKFKPIPLDLDATGLNPRKAKRAIETALGIVAVTALQDFQGIVRGWEHKPEFRIVKEDDHVSVGTDDDVFKFVDEGTRPHTIRARRAKFLRFMAGARAKTTPGSLRSGSGGGGSLMFRRSVNHPGSKARGFSKMVAKRAQDRLPDEMNRQLEKAR